MNKDKKIKSYEEFIKSLKKRKIALAPDTHNPVDQTGQEKTLGGKYPQGGF
jgi:hypothetical protein